MVDKMDAETKRELDLMWKHGVEEVRADVRGMREEFRTEIKAVTNGIIGTRRWIAALMATAIPTWVTAYLAVRK